jgi:hypothetical protein
VDLFHLYARQKLGNFRHSLLLQIAVEQERVASLKSKMERMAEELHGQEDALDSRQSDLQAAQSQLWSKASMRKPLFAVNFIQDGLDQISIEE